MGRTMIVVALLCSCVGCAGSGPSGTASGASAGTSVGGGKSSSTPPGSTSGVGTRGAPGAGTGAGLGTGTGTGTSGTSSSPPLATTPPPSTTPSPGTTGGSSGSAPASGTPASSTPASGGASSATGSAGGGGSTGAGSGLTFVYINSSDGTIYGYDSANWSVETMIVSRTGAFSISSGPLPDTLYLQMSSYSAGPLRTYNLTTHVMTDVGGAVPGNSLGEGRNGSLYAGSGVEFYRVDPSNGAATYVGDGNFDFAGDLAVDPTTGIMYGTVSGPRGVALAIIDRASGSQQLIGTLGVSGSIWGLGFSGNGNLFAAGPDGSGGGTIFKLDKTNGAALAVRALGYEPYDMATQPYNHPEGPPVPEKAPGAAVYLGESFDGEVTALRSSGSALWEVGAPASGPRGAASGARCLEARLAGLRGPCADAVETQPVRLVGAGRPVLVIRHWYDLEDGRDLGVVSVVAARGETALAPESGAALGFTGRSRAWVESTFDLSRWAGETDVRIRFTLAAGGRGAVAGWFVDDILVEERP